MHDTPSGVQAGIAAARGRREDDPVPGAGHQFIPLQPDIQPDLGPSGPPQNNILPAMDGVAEVAAALEDLTYRGFCQGI